ncbi:SDR family NAD(P)-dependent oxidoreductase [Dactylosporangium sucinum]|uniref:Oxidoreductase n=1 Tax=Dactylosporangium sucinum TaxID=1424081 RepID=A0A917X5A2_9ACTN|nr:SDR family NAD(P)-dependent oxidoreductase [Dactylosporangium sucinum]GGM69504.1 oxidoreductase [Dactylosporangium sucinum]
MAALDGLVAVVTGAGSVGPGVGNGRAAAIRLAEEGARVALLDMESSVEDTLDMIQQRGGEAAVFRCDVTDAEMVEQVVAATVAHFGRLDILFNNVGIAGPPGTVVDVDLEAWRRCLDVNLTSMVLTSRACIPRMRKAGAGSIINMSSLAGLRGGHAAVAYATTKGAVISLTQAMASQHGRESIRVNAVAPGLVYTPMVSTKSGVDEATRALRASLNVLGTEGTAWDVAEAVLYLADPRSRWVTGVVLPVDAGAAMHSEAIEVSVTEAGATRGGRAAGAR